MSKTAPVLVALFCSLLTLEVVAAPARKGSEAQLLAGLLAGLRIAEAEVMQTYLANPKPEVLRAFVAATDSALKRIDAAGWRPGWGPMATCPDGSIHCDGCGCMYNAVAPGCRPKPPSDHAKMTDAELMATLHQTFAILELDILQHFVHGPRKAVVESMIDELRTTVKETRQTFDKQP